MAKAPHPKAKSTDRIEFLITKLTPQFGNERQIQIIKDYNNVLSLRSRVLNDNDRRIENNKIIKENRVLRSEIKKKEERLLFLLLQEVKIESPFSPKK
jgi:hypothetical protein